MTDTYTPVLTPEQIDQVRRSMQPWQHMTDFARAIERAAKAQRKADRIAAVRALNVQ